MTISKTIQSVVIAAFGMLFISQAQAVPSYLNNNHMAGNYKCRPPVRSGWIKKKTRGEATQAALNIWRKKAAGRWGHAFGNWKSSKPRSLQCKQIKDISGGQYSCRARGRPCTLVPPVSKR